MKTLPKIALTLDEAAAAVGLSRDTLKRAITAGQLKAKRSSVDEEGNPQGRYTVTPKALEDWHDSLPDA